MPEQVYNPLGFHCAPNQASPDYVSYFNFRNWLAYGLIECWLSHDPDDCSVDTSFCEVWTREHVAELRDHFLDLVETLVVGLWQGDHEPGEGEIDITQQYVVLGSDEDDGEMLNWWVRLDDDSMMFVLSISDCSDDASCIWLDYEAVRDRAKVLKAITDARATLPDYANKVWPKLIEAAAVVDDYPRPHGIIEYCAMAEPGSVLKGVLDGDNAAFIKIDSIGMIELQDMWLDLSDGSIHHPNGIFDNEFITVPVALKEWKLEEPHEATKFANVGSVQPSSAAVTSH